MSMAKGKDERMTGDDTGLADLETLLGSPPPGTGGKNEPSAKPTSRREQAEVLKTRAAGLAKAYTFVPGQLVSWKQGMKNRRYPSYGVPVVVIEVLDPPVHERSNKGGAGSSLFREPLSLVAGTIDNDGDLLCFHYDGRRMEPYEE